MKKLLYLLIFILLFTGCSQLTDSVEKLDYKYGVILTSNIHNESEIVFYGENGTYKKSIKLDVGGLREFRKYKDKLYIPVLGIPSKPNNKIVELDINNLTIRYLTTENLPVKVVVKDRYLYSIHNSSLDSGYITKLDIEDNRIVSKKKIMGVPREINASDDYVYAITDDPKGHEQRIYKLDFDLNEVKQLSNKITAFPTDSIFIKDSLILVNVAKNDFTGPTNQLFMINTSTYQSKALQLKERAPYKIYKTSEKQLIIHYDPPVSSGDKISVIDNDNNQRVYQLQNNLFRTKLSEDKLFSIELGKLYKYSLNNFNLEKTFEMETPKDMVIVDFFVKDNPISSN